MLKRSSTDTRETTFVMLFCNSRRVTMAYPIMYWCPILLVPLSSIGLKSLVQDQARSNRSGQVLPQEENAVIGSAWHCSLCARTTNQTQNVHRIFALPPYPILEIQILASTGVFRQFQSTFAHAESLFFNTFYCEAAARAFSLSIFSFRTWKL